VIVAPESPRDNQADRGRWLVLNHNGWYLITTAGSHRQYKHPLKPGRVTIAGKPSAELPPGTERSILKQAGLDRRTQ
jgi:predicted RNA binding protein YcfA (HicA-like mRNA interferase family)